MKEVSSNCHNNSLVYLSVRFYEHKNHSLLALPVFQMPFPGRPWLSALIEAGWRTARCAIDSSSQSPLTGSAPDPSKGSLSYVHLKTSLLDHTTKARVSQANLRRLSTSADACNDQQQDPTAGAGGLPVICADGHALRYPEQSSGPPVRTVLLPMCPVQSVTHLTGSNRQAPTAERWATGHPCTSAKGVATAQTVRRNNIPVTLPPCDHV